MTPPLDMRLVATVGTVTRLSRLEDKVVAHREALQALARELADCAREAARLERMVTTLVLPALREARDAALETGAQAAAELDNIVRSHRP